MFSQLPIPGDEIFISEVHYTNDGSDSGEGIEIAGPAGTDLSDYTIYFYRDVGTVYDSKLLDGIIPNEQNGFGAVWFPITGIQNGPNDGIVLYNEVDINFEIISYEGVFTASAGVANTITSVDIGVFETGSTPIGQSLQLIGTGNVRSDFSWSGPITATPGAINSNQTFSATAAIKKSKIEGFAVYPNPVTNGKFKIESVNGSSKILQLFDLLGKQVFYKSVKRNKMIDVSALNPGMYILKIQEEGNIATRKLVIE